MPRAPRPAPMRAHMNCVLTPGDSVNSDGDHKDIKGHGGVFTPIYIAVDRKTEWEISISADPLILPTSLLNKAALKKCEAIFEKMKAAIAE